MATRTGPRAGLRGNDYFGFWGRGLMISLNATIVVQIINLLVLLVILNKILYRPVRRIMTERRQQVEGGLLRAGDLRREVRHKSQTYTRDMAKGKAEVRHRLKEMLEETESKSQKLISESHAKAREEVRRFEEGVERQMIAAKGQIADEAKKLAETMATQVLGREL